MLAAIDNAAIHSLTGIITPIKRLVKAIDPTIQHTCQKYLAILRLSLVILTSLFPLQQPSFEDFDQSFGLRGGLDLKFR